MALLAMGLASCWTGAAALPSGLVFWTSPTQVVAGEPSRLVATASIACSTERVDVEREGEHLHVLVRVVEDDDSLCFSTPVPSHVVVDMPALEAGSYALDIVETRGGEPLREPTVLPDYIVSVATLPEEVEPAEGFWFVPGRPGTGLFLEKHAGLVAAALYGFDLPTGVDGQPPVWRLGSAPLLGNALLLGTLRHVGGSCFGCEPYSPPPWIAGQPMASALRMRFESARRAWVDFADGTTLGFVSTPFGVSYTTTLADEVDADFGALALPDLEGEWVFAIEGEDGDTATRTLRLGAAQLVQGSDPLRVVFDGAGASGFSCQAASESQRAGCTLEPGLILDPPPPEPFGAFAEGPWFIPLGDIEEDRMRGIIEADGQRWRIRGFRVDGAAAAAPATAVD